MSLPEKEPHYPLYWSTSLQPSLANNNNNNNNKKNKRQKPTQNSNK
jgi:hypothetical protein